MLQDTAEFTQESFPSDASVRILVAGLAFCKLKTDVSEINFLSHVPHHKLNIIFMQRRRDSDTPLSMLATMIEPYHTVSVKADNALVPEEIAAPGEYPLTELINITDLHNGKIDVIEDLPPEVTPPIPLSVDNCAFYTAAMTKDDFELIDSDASAQTTVARKKIGYAMGGKIRCENVIGNLTVEIKGASATKITRPLKDAGGDLVYDIWFSNHCTEKDECVKLMSQDSDFRFYYDLLKDSVTPDRKFKLKKISEPGGPKEGSSIDVAACNVVIVEPPFDGFIK